jgi:signal transduction histidine kinase
VTWSIPSLTAMAVPTPDPVPAGPEASARVRVALAEALKRRDQRTHRFAPLGVAVMAIVVGTTISGTPGPGSSGKPLVITVGLVAYLVALAALTLSPRPDTRTYGAIQVGLVAVVGVAGIVLASAQISGPSELPASVAVLIAYLMFDTALATAIAAPITVALAIAVGGPEGGNASDVISTVLLDVVLAVAASLATQARRSQDRAELLLAQLEDAREIEAEAAATTERARIAGELHDVLAHSLSGLAIQMQLARKLAQREGVSDDLTAVIDRAGSLTRDGLAEARRAVGALKGGALPTVDQLPALVETYRQDLGLAVSLEIQGDPRPVTSEVSLAVYRGAQEALTNAARYAAGSTVRVTLRYDIDVVSLAVEDSVADSAVSPGDDGGAGRDIVGGGHGLAGMRERIARVGGTVRAGPTATGWLVTLTMPA